MEYKDLIKTAYCCDIKACDDCPSKGRTCCRERAMQELSHALDKEAARAESAESAQETLQRTVAEYKDMAEKAEREMDAAIFDLLRAEEAAKETNALLDDEVHPACDYSLYLAVHDSVSDIVNWEREDVWRGKKEK